MLPVQEMRGIAVMLVLIVHAINTVDYRFYTGIDEQHGFLATFLCFNDFGASGVDLFFVISGFIMAFLLRRDPNRDASEFLYRRFIRIVPLFWLAALSFSLLNWLVGTTIPPVQLIANVTIFPPALAVYHPPFLTVGWSLGFELIFYGLVASVLKFENRIFILALLVLLCAILGMTTRQNGIFSLILNPIQIEFFLGILAFFLCNAKIMKSARIKVPVGGALFFLGSVTLLVQAAWGYPFETDFIKIINNETGFIRALFWGLPWAMTFCGHVLMHHTTEKTRPNFLSRAGDASYMLYLTHMSVCLIAENLVPANALSADMLIVIVLLASWAAGTAAHQWIEKPVLSWLTSVRQAKAFLRPPAPPAPSGHSR